VAHVPENEVVLPPFAFHPIPMHPCESVPIRGPKR
jgi:hypothetical protein